MSKPMMLSARILIEPGAEHPDRLRSYVISSVKNSCRNIRDGNVVIGLYDENDHLIGMDIAGEPSEVLQESIDKIFDQYEEGDLG